MTGQTGAAFHERKCIGKLPHPSQQETLGQIVVEILRAGNNLNRKAVCSKLIRRLDVAASPEEERHYHELISLLFGR